MLLQLLDRRADVHRINEGYRRPDRGRGTSYWVEYLGARLDRVGSHTARFAVHIEFHAEPPMHFVGNFSLPGQAVVVHSHLAGLPVHVHLFFLPLLVCVLVSHRGGQVRLVQVVCPGDYGAVPGRVGE